MLLHECSTEPYYTEWSTDRAHNLIYLFPKILAYFLAVKKTSGCTRSRYCICLCLCVCTSPSLTSITDDEFSRNFVRTRTWWRPPQHYVSSDDHRHNIYEVGVVTELITTQRLHIVTDLHKVSKFFKAIFLLDTEQYGSLARIFSRCRDDGDNQLELWTINLCLEIEHKCT
jgi:hypothetical protein